MTAHCHRYTLAPLAITYLAMYALSWTEGWQTLLSNILRLQNVRDQAMGLAEGEKVPWRDLRDLTESLR